MKSKVYEIKNYGQSIWLDEIRREFLVSGELKRMIEEDGVTGMTTNPTIFEKAITGSTLYDKEIKTLAQKGKTVAEIYDHLTWKDARAVCEELEPIYKETQGLDGYVSVEVPAHLAYDAQGSIKEALRIKAAIGRENIFIKIPGTPVGAEVIRNLTAAGVNVNVTLLFSLEQYERAARAYLEGLRDLEAQEKDLGKVASVASIFVSRIDTATDKEIDKTVARETDLKQKEELKSLRGKAAIANTKLVYQKFKEVWAQSEFKAVIEKGAKAQWLVWGSTSTKDPAYSDVKYVENLIGPQTVNTIPQATLEDFCNHGLARPSLEEGLPESQADLARISAAGIDLDEIYERLQKEGVAAFDASYQNLLRVIEAKLELVKE